MPTVLEELRNKNTMAQVQSAEFLGVFKGTIAMLEIGKRKPLGTLSDIFDRRTDYILGYSNDTSSPAPSEEVVELLNKRKISTKLLCGYVLTNTANTP